MPGNLENNYTISPLTFEKSKQKKPPNWSHGARGMRIMDLDQYLEKMNTITKII